MELTSLYKRAKTGKIVYWKIEVIPRFNNGNGGYSIHKETGQLDTDKPVTHDELISVGKNIGRSNETTPLEQAESQALSDWKKKKDEGYKDLPDLGVNFTKELMRTLTGGITYGGKVYQDWDSYVSQILEDKLPRENTDANGNVKPMLAHEAKKHEKKVVFPVFVQPKFDGVRCLAIVKRGEVTFLSRKGKEIILPHIKGEIYNLNHKEDIIFDGELYSDELTFQEITSAVKKISTNTLKIKYRVYDLLNSNKACERQNTLHKIFLTTPSNIIIPTINEVCSSWDQIKTTFGEYTQAGYEGLMIRSMEGLYGFGQRSYDLLKYKEFDDDEFPITHFILGQREEDLLAVCPVPKGYTGDKKDFKPKMMGSKEDKKRLVDEYGLNTPIIDKVVSLKFFGWTDDGIPRFPVGKAIRDYEG